MSEPELLNKYFSEHEEVLKAFWCNNNLVEVANIITKCLRNGGTVYTFGNGGSAAEASHLVGELVGRFEKERKPYPAVCLNTDLSVITAIANDYGYNHVFSKQVMALVKSNDVVIGFSTSGMSQNVNLALSTAKEYSGATTIGFIGWPKEVPDSTHISRVCDVMVVVPSKRTSIIQEMHLLAIHYIASQVEKDIG
jgi:D-sedoheptulose 7-phosphate isomerase